MKGKKILRNAIRTPYTVYSYITSENICHTEEGEKGREEREKSSCR